MALLLSALPGRVAWAAPDLCTRSPLSASQYAVGTSPTSIAVADFDKDGNLDFATAHSSGPIAVGIFFGGGDGTFPSGSLFPGASSTEAVGVGDWNRDGNLDLITINSSTRALTVYLGDGQKGFSPMVLGTLARTPSALGVGDFNGDGVADVAIVSRTDSAVTLFLGNGAGSFIAGVDYSPGPKPYAISVGDIDKDGKDDIVVPSYDGSWVSVLRGQSNGFAQPTRLATSPVPVYAALADLNNDGRLDLIVAHNGLINGIEIGELQAYLGNGQGGFVPTPQGSVALSTPAFGVGSVVAIDLNLDGNLDLVMSDYFSSVLQLRTGDGTGRIADTGTPPEVIVGAGPWAIGIDDFNRDSLPDVAVVGTSGNNVTIVQGCHVNAAPVVTVPSGQTSPQPLPLTLSGATNNAVSIEDADSGPVPLRVSVGVQNGTLTLARTTGLTFSSGDGTDDATMTFTGLAADVRAAFDGLRFTPPPGFLGAASVSVTVNDQGGRGTGGAKETARTFTIAVTANPQPPTAVNDSYATTFGAAVTTSAPGLLANDVSPSGTPLSAVKESDPGHGTLTLNTDGSFTYTPRAGYAGPDIFTYRATNGGRQSNVATVAITVNGTACTPRPRVTTTPSISGGALIVRVEATPLSATQNNLLQEVRLGTLQNARVTLNGQAVTSGQTYSVPSGATTVGFAVERIAAGQAVTVPFTVVDGCGAWPTFVGGGPTAGF